MGAAPFLLRPLQWLRQAAAGGSPPGGLRFGSISNLTLPRFRRCSSEPRERSTCRGASPRMSRGRDWPPVRPVLVLSPEDSNADGSLMSTWSRGEMSAIPSVRDAANGRAENMPRAMHTPEECDNALAVWGRQGQNKRGRSDCSPRPRGFPLGA